jgi:hypothetical protein
MATYDYWTGYSSNWDTPSAWSDGLPDSSSHVVISGTYRSPQATKSIGAVASIAIAHHASLILEAGKSAVAGDVTLRSGLLYLDPATTDAGPSLTIGRRLTNDGGEIEIEADNAASTIQAAHLSNTGAVLVGGLSAQAALDVASAAGFGTAGTLTGYVALSDDALLEFNCGQITTIAANSELVLNGSHAFVADASNTGSNSALKGLSVVEATGDLFLEDGAMVKTSGAFTNDGSVQLDDDDDYEKLAGAVSGTGDFYLGIHSKLEFGSSVSSGETVDFSHPVKPRIDTLVLDQASSFNGTIDDFFTKGDSVVAKTFAEAQTLLTYTQTGADSCSWTLTNGANTAVLNFAGAAYAQSDFSIAPTSNGAGTVIKFV